MIFMEQDEPKKGYIDIAVEKMRAANKERGYSLSDMKKIENKIRMERNEWIRRFEVIVQQIIEHDMDKQPQKVVDYAGQIADKMDEKIKEKFGDIE